MKITPAIEAMIEKALGFQFIDKEPQHDLRKHGVLTVPGSDWGIEMTITPWLFKFYRPADKTYVAVIVDYDDLLAAIKQADKAFRDYDKELRTP